MNAKRILSATVIVALIAAGPLGAIEEEWHDKKLAKKGEPKTANSVFKLDGVIWPAFEVNDHSDTGAADSAGPGSEKTGFKVGRAYVNFRGAATSGEWKGWSFRATIDLAPADTFGDGCGADNLCAGDNDYVLFMKYAYVDMPLFDGAYLRMGQAGTPMVGGSGTGSDSQKLWDHRYLDADGKAHWDQLGLSSSTERGLGFFYAAEYFGAHFLLGNGESYHRNNAERVAGANDSLSELAAGAGDSYGLDLYAQLAVRPFGKSKSNQIHIMLPFRQHNITGVDQSELEYTTLDLSTPAAPKWSRLVGDKRAKQDTAYGVEAVYVREFAHAREVTVGIGTATKIDRRGRAFRYSEDTSPFGLADSNCATGRVCIQEDERGRANYVYAHFRWGSFGAFSRLMVGNGSTTSTSGKLEPAAGGDYAKTLLRKDAEDGVLGNLKLSEARALDFGLARFRNVLVGVTWHAHERFRVSFGVSRITATDVEGRRRRENALQRVDAQSPSTADASQQFQNTFLADPGLSGVTTNDLIGRKAEERQVFVRAQYAF